MVVDGDGDADEVTGSAHPGHRERSQLSEPVRSMATRRSPAEIAVMRRGRIVSSPRCTRSVARPPARASPPATSTGSPERCSSDVGATSNFLGYHGFPAVICASVNDEVVHGIPGDRVLEDGDVLSIDCGAVIDGWHGDAAFTMGIGR